MVNFYMRPKNAKQGHTAVAFADLQAFMEFVRNVGEVTIVADKERDVPLLLLPHD